MKILKLFLIIFLLPSFANAACAENYERTALNLRALQSSMMVAALSCDQQDNYNKFIQKFQDDLANGGDYIKAFFIRNYGKAYQSKLNHFITSLANKATKSSMQSDSDEYCDQTKATFKTLFKLRQDKIDDFAEQKKFSHLHGFKSCS